MILLSACFETAFSMTSITFFPSNKLLQSKIAAGAADNRRSYFSPMAWRGEGDVWAAHLANKHNTGRLDELAIQGDISVPGAHLPQMLENGDPFATGHRLWQHWKTLAAPGLMRNAGRGLVVETNFSKLFVVQYTRYNTTNTRH